MVKASKSEFESNVSRLPAKRLKCVAVGQYILELYQGPPLADNSYVIEVNKKKEIEDEIVYNKVKSIWFRPESKSDNYDDTYEHPENEAINKFDELKRSELRLEKYLSKLE